MPYANRLFLLAPLLLCLCANAAGPDAAATERKNKEELQKGEFMRDIAFNSQRFNALSEINDKMEPVCKKYGSAGIAERNAATTKALYAALEKRHPGITERAATLRKLIPPRMGEVLREASALAIPSTETLEADKALANQICTNLSESLQRDLDGFNQGRDFLHMSAEDFKKMLELDVDRFGKEMPQYDLASEEEIKLEERKFEEGKLEQLRKEADAKAKAKKKAAAQ